MSEPDDPLNVARELSVPRTPAQVWQFVCDMGNWAAQMPGYISHEQLGPDDSVWTLQLNIGPFERPVAIDVHVLRWDEPHHVDFEIKGKHDPFVGSGKFHSVQEGDATRIVLAFRAEPTGSMARVLAPLMPPILNEVADQFSANLAKVLGRTTPTAAADQVPQRRGFWAWLMRKLLRRKSG